jgi:hypothetical protein
MGVFGPRYSPELQAVVNHAERFCELLARLAENRRSLRARAMVRAPQPPTPTSWT